VANFTPFQQPYCQLGGQFFRPCHPEPLNNSIWVARNESLITEHQLKFNDTELLRLASGQLDESLTPIAQKYTGHQFGYYNPDLGDGRGLLLGQGSQVNGLAYDWHLKGAGRTPFSRGGDGRAVLRSCIREYLASEAMAGLGIPSSRALTVVSNDETVWREGPESRAALLRLTPSHIRFGHFEWAAQLGAVASKQLADYVIEQHFPKLADKAEPYTALLTEIVTRTAKLIAQWQSVGFNHGVMNTDNFSILGETFDYGPYAFMDDCQIGYICNHSDHAGRYAYNEQPQIGLWNCQVLAASFANLIPDTRTRDAIINNYVTTYNQHYITLMRHKLGLVSEEVKDKELVAELIILMDKHALDWSCTWRELAQPFDTQFASKLGDYQAWWQAYQQRLNLESITEDNRKSLIYKNNPQLVLRNYIAQQAIERAETGDVTWIDELRKALQNPFEASEEWLMYTQRPSQRQKGLRLSCSS
jgi:hypothetical protein